LLSQRLSLTINRYLVIVFYKMKLKQGEKKSIILKLLYEPKNNKRNFWAREIKFLNELYELFPDIGFWKLLNFKKKYDSLLFLKGDYGLRTLKRKFLEFSYVIPENKEVIIGDKSGKDYGKIIKPKTIKQFLTNE
jgi:hypothetical protein